MDLTMDKNKLCAEGDRYYNECNYAEAIDYYIKAAENERAAYGYKNPISYIEYRIGECYFNGKGVKQDYSEAKKWFHKSAEHGYSEAFKLIGYLEDHATDGSTKSLLADYWYTKYINQGDVDRVKWVIQNRRYKNDPQKYYLWCFSAAKSGGINLRSLAFNFYTGSDSFPKDSQIAFYCYELAAQYGDPKSIKISADSIMRIIQSQYNIYEAFDMYYEAAELGCADAKFAVYACDKHYLAQKRDLPNMRIEWLNIIEELYLWNAAICGCILAQMELASLCYYGLNILGFYESYKWAFIWCNKAIRSLKNNCDPFAAAIMGELFFLGRGTKKDLTEARKWFETAKNNLPSDNSEYHKMLNKALVQRLKQIDDIYSSSSEEKFYNGELKFEEIKSLVPFKSYSPEILYGDYSIFSQDNPITEDDVDENYYKDILNINYYFSQLSDKSISAEEQKDLEERIVNYVHIGKIRNTQTTDTNISSEQNPKPQNNGGNYVHIGKEKSNNSCEKDTTSAQAESGITSKDNDKKINNVSPKATDAPKNENEKKSPENEKANEIADVIEKIIALRGIDVFNEKKIFLNIFADLSPDNKRYRKFLRNSLEEGIAVDILDSTLDHQVKYNRIKDKIQQAGLRDEVMSILLISIVKALKLNLEIK